MKRCILFSIMIMCLIINSLAQKPEKKSNSPKEDVRINWEYDKQGNLIKFDSIHSYSWSSDTTLLKSLSPEDLPFHFDQHFGFLSDSAFFSNSFFDDFFNNFNDIQGDSITAKSHKHTHNFFAPESADEMIKMLQQQMQEMEEYQQKIFKEKPKGKEF